MAKSNKENIITDILIELEKGIERSDCLATVGKKWQLPTRTFDRHWKTAQERHLANQKELQNQLATISTEASKERLKTEIIAKEERMQILTDIALGNIPLKKAMVVNGKVELIDVVPDWMDRKNAIAELNKMDGSYSPLKTVVQGDADKPIHHKVEISIVPTGKKIATSEEDVDV